MTATATATATVPTSTSTSAAADAVVAVRDHDTASTAAPNDGAQRGPCPGAFDPIRGEHPEQAPCSGSSPQQWWS
ncbi:hypothetical protein ACQ86G_24010 [Roseateles chitinivorans]|uniref:hypothetical protein n=1 Tax=Roseateles chitinivorans TaxID=2917965 RepID=UPI003D67A899